MDTDTRWQAVLDRNHDADGAFVFAVRSTGVYCRPSCGARRPRRERVAFFDTPAAAESAGFRACLRCRPNEALSADQRAALVSEVCRLLDANDENTPSLADLSARTGVSPHHLQRTFKQVMGVSPRQYAAARRLERLKERLREGAAVTDALYDAGYGSSSRLYEQSDAALGMTPAAYRRGGKGQKIGYTTVNCPLGRLLVAAAERGVCAVSLGDDDAALEAALRREYPAASIERNGDGLEEYVAVLLQHLEGQRPRLDLPLDVQATAFQRRVWEALRAIPYGEVRSYGEVARAIGQPTAARAVARACAANPAALVTPCHRVVREGGAPGGYRWGAERKRRLLAQEQAAVEDNREAQVVGETG